MKLRKYTYREFLQLDIEELADYEGILRYLTPVASLGETAVPVQNLPFIDVRTMMDYFTGRVEMTEEVIPWAVGLVSGIKDEAVYNFDIFAVYSVVNFIRDQLDRFIQYENGAFSGGEIDTQAIMAGSEELQKFGIYNELDALSNGDGTKYTTAMQIPYYIAIKKLHRDYVARQIERRMYRLKPTNG